MHDGDHCFHTFANDDTIGWCCRDQCKDICRSNHGFYEKTHGGICMTPPLPKVVAMPRTRLQEELDQRKSEPPRADSEVKKPWD